MQKGPRANQIERNLLLVPIKVAQGLVAVPFERGLFEDGSSLCGSALLNSGARNWMP